MKIAIFHDHFGATGSAEKATMCMATALDADITTKDARLLGVLAVIGKCISLVGTVKLPPLKQTQLPKSSVPPIFPTSTTLFCLQRQLGAVCCEIRCCHWWAMVVNNVS